MNKTIQTLLSYEIYGNSGSDYLIALVVLLGSLIVLKVAQKIIIARLKILSTRTKTEIDNVAVDILAGIKPPFYLVVAFYLGVRMLKLSGSVRNFVQIIFLSVIVYESIQAIQKIIQFFTYRALKKIKMIIRLR